MLQMRAVIGRDDGLPQSVLIKPNQNPDDNKDKTKRRDLIACSLYSYEISLK
jgi:hypothetical protein